MMWISSVLHIPSSSLRIALNSLGEQMKRTFKPYEQAAHSEMFVLDSCSDRHNGLLLDDNLSNGKQLPRPWGTGGVGGSTLGRPWGIPGGVSRVRWSLSA